MKLTPTSEGNINAVTWKALTQIRDRKLLESRNHSLVVFTHQQHSSLLRTEEFRVLELLELWGLVQIHSNTEGPNLDLTTLSVIEPDFSDYYKKFYKARKTFDLNETQITPDTDLNEILFYWPEEADWITDLTFSFRQGFEVNFKTNRSKVYKVFKKLTDKKSLWVKVGDLNIVGGPNLNKTISQLRSKFKKPPLTNMITIEPRQKLSEKNTKINTDYRIKVRK